MPHSGGRRAAAGSVFMISLACLTTSRPAAASAGCSPDVDGDHIVAMDDLAAVINSWGSCPGTAPCAADIVPDGVVNIDDLFVLLNSWGECPCVQTNGCVSATQVWFEDFELLNYSRWTDGYASDNSCDTVGFNGSQYVSPTHSHRSVITCATADSHRGYGGLRFLGDTALPSFGIPSTGGINAPNGVVVTFNSRLTSPYTFNSSQWVSFMTITSDCSNNWNNVLTLNIDDSSMRLKPVHITGGAYAPNAPSFPLNQWVRVTVYVNFYTGQMHVWQNGVKVCNATFSQPGNTMCQWHFGLYASGPNHDLTLYEDDIKIVKLNAPLTNFNAEPWF